MVWALFVKTIHLNNLTHVSTPLKTSQDGNTFDWVFECVSILTFKDVLNSYYMVVKHFQKHTYTEKKYFQKYE